MSAGYRFWQPAARELGPRLSWNLLPPRSVRQEPPEGILKAGERTSVISGVLPGKVSLGFTRLHTALSSELWNDSR